MPVLEGVIERVIRKISVPAYKKRTEDLRDLQLLIYIMNSWNYVRLIQTYPDRDDLTKEALEWFKLLGLSKGQIDSLKRAIRPDYYLAVYSSAEGYAVSRDFDPETYFFSDSKGENDPETFLAGTGNVGLTDGITIETGDPLI